MEEEKDVTETKNATKTKKSKKGIIITIILIVIILILAIAGLLFYHTQQIAILTEEVNKTVSDTMSLNGKVKINMQIKSKGSYAVVEKTIKDYLNKTVEVTKQAENIINKKELSEILSIENMKNDGPDFLKTKEKVASMRKNAENYLDKIITLCNKENLLSAIDNKKVSNYYKELYKNLVINEKAVKDLEKTVKEIEETKEEVTKTFDYIEKIINFLSENKSAWKIDGKQILFYDQGKLNEYNKIVLDMPKK